MIVLGRDASWNAVIDDLADLFGAHRGRRAADRARSAFRVPLTDGRGFAGLVDVCRDLLGAPVAVLDDYLDVLAEVGVDDTQTQQLDGAVRDARGPRCGDTARCVRRRRRARTSPACSSWDPPSARYWSSPPGCRRP